MDLRYGVCSRKTVDGHFRRNATRHIPTTQPHPAGFENCYPPSSECAEKVLGVPPHHRYLIDVCPTGCIHWWTHMEQPGQHLKRCKHGCHLCKCPHCGARRFIEDKKGLRGAQTCWLFFDVLQTMFLSPDLAEAMLKGRIFRDEVDHPSCPSFGKYEEYTRLREVLGQHQFEMDKVCIRWLGCRASGSHRGGAVPLQDTRSEIDGYLGDMSSSIIRFGQHSVASNMLGQCR